MKRWRQPAEWAPQEACWLAWPSDAAEWAGEIEGARRAVVEFARALSHGQRVELLAMAGESEETARRALAGVPVRFHDIPFGDIWLRDTGPVFLQGASGKLGAATFRWTGWAGKYLFAHDDQVAGRIAREVGARRFDHAIAAEGGALEVDGEGTVITTRQCLLHPGRNPGLDEAEVARQVAAAIGATSVLWLDRGLENDHTDGHIDTLARFVAPGRVVCMEPAGAGDPNREVLEGIAHQLRAMRDARGRPLEVILLPSPGRIDNRRGELVAASYCNFYIGDKAVVVPAYGAVGDQDAIDILAALFPGRKVVGIDARALVSGGGAFHCISQQQPAAAVGAGRPP